MFASQGADVLVMRTKIEGAQRFIAEILEEEGYEISVQNGGDGTNQHPTQTFLDLLTVSKWLKKIKIGYCGDLKYGRTVHSLLCALSYREEISVVLVSPAETKLQEQYKGLFPGKIQESDELKSLADCDVIYLSRIQEERFRLDPIALQRIRDKFRITKNLLDTFKKDVIIMHPMPYVTEITPEVRRDKRIIIDDQAWCGIPTRMFLLDEGYKNKRKNAISMPNQDSQFNTVVEMSLDKYFKQRQRSKLVDTYFFPIKNGTVIDHIPEGLGLKIREFLSVNNFLFKGVKHIIEDVSSQKNKIKDVLVLEDIFIPDQIMSAISSLAPTITFNIVGEGNFRKVKIKAPAIISGIGTCPNDNCITNHDPEAQPKFTHQDTELHCYYCEKNFKQKEVI